MTTEAEHLRSETLRKELRALRTGKGITHDRVKRTAHVLLELAAVADEVRRNPQLSRSAAAYEVVKCGVRAIKQPDYRQILNVTLNIEGNQVPRLIDRQHTLQEQLGISQNTYGGQEGGAFLELQALLEAAHESPCRTLSAPTPEELVSMAERRFRRHSDEIINVPIPVSLLAPIGIEILRWLTTTSDPGEVDAMKSALVSLFPNLRRYRSRMTPTEILVTVLRNLATESSAVQMSFDEIALMLSAIGEAAITERFSMHRARRPSPWQRLLQRISPSLRRQFYSYRGVPESIGNYYDSATSLARALAQIEEENIWDLYLLPPEVSARLP